jgi:hypothetical protein
MDQIWQHNDETDASTQEDLDSSHHMRNYVEKELTNVDKLFQEGSDESQLTSLLHETRLAVLDEDYWKDQQSFNHHCGEWEHYATRLTIDHQWYMTYAVEKEDSLGVQE